MNEKDWFIFYVRQLNTCKNNKDLAKVSLSFTHALDKEILPYLLYIELYSIYIQYFGKFKK